MQVNSTGDAENGQFKHSPLPDATAYIRLQSIESEDASSASEPGFALSIWRFDDAPLYHAISYTWGSPDDNEIIELDGKAKSLRRNCADILRQIRHFRTAQYYWIDTLCIDQSNVEGKSRQVAVMGRIYKAANEVLVCPGVIEAGYESGWRLLCEFDEYFVGGHIDFEEDVVDWSIYWRAPREDLEQFRRWAASKSSGSTWDMWLLCKRLAMSDYFERAWTVPEFLVAREVKLYFGNHIVRWQSLRAVIQSCTKKGFRGLKHIWKPQKTQSAERGVEGSQLLQGRLQKMQRLLMTKSSYLGSGQAGPTSVKDEMSMGDAISLSYERKCQDPRDHIYAMLPIVDRTGQRQVVPDYTKTPFDLATDVARCYYLEPSNTLHLLRGLGVNRSTADVRLGLEARA